MAFSRTTVIDSSPTGDSAKQAVLDLDTDLSNAFTHLNTLNTAVSQRIASSEKGQASGVADLDSSGKLKAAQFPTSGVGAAPIGSIMIWATDTPPTDWIECDGRYIGGGGYAALVTALGGNYVPDLRGYFVRGWDSGGSVDSGRSIGSVQQDAMTDHRHLIGGNTGKATGGASVVDPGSPGTNPCYTQSTEATTGSAIASETRPKNVALMYIIRYQ